MSQDESFFDKLRTQNTENSEQVADDKSDNSSDNKHKLKQKGMESQEPEAPAENAVVNQSALPPDAKRALVSLLRFGVILISQKAKLFESLCRYEGNIRAHLANMYLKLTLDEKAGVCFVRSIDEGDLNGVQGGEAGAENEDTGDPEETVSLITHRTLTLYDTLLLLVLRKHYQDRESSGEQKVVIDIERVEANLMPFLLLTNNSKSDRKKLNAALQKMIEKRVLSAIRSADDRYEITPIIRYVVNAEFLETMLIEYQRLATEAGVDTQGTADLEIEDH